jgi:hypothetical protein
MARPISGRFSYCKSSFGARSVLGGFSALWLLIFITVPSGAAEKARLRVDDHQIDAELPPSAPDFGEGKGQIRRPSGFEYRDFRIA